VASRIGREFAVRLDADGDVLGLHNCTDVVKVVLALLHTSASSAWRTAWTSSTAATSRRYPSGSCRADHDKAAGPEMVDAASDTRGPFNLSKARGGLRIPAVG
jgi:hypothetical protein